MLNVLQIWRQLPKLFAVCIVFTCNQPFARAAFPADGIQVYQQNVHLNAVHKQRLADDISKYQHADNLWDALREDFSLPHYEDNPQVQERIEWFLDNQDYLIRAATRAAPYLYYISQQVKKRHLPAELVLLPIIESGYNPFSYSNVGAAGIWQLMPDTASSFGVRQDWWFDGRRDMVASTRAALNYLSYLQNFFEGNWLLAIAAYNTGEGNVLNAMRRNIHSGRRTDFWSLPLSQQTRDYVPSLLALATIISRPNDFPLYFPPVRNAPYLAQVDVGKQINLKVAAALAGISYPRLMQLNSGFNRTMMSKGPYKIILPIENVQQFTENLSRSTTNHDMIHYKVKLGDTFAKISKKFNVSVENLRKSNVSTANPLRPGTNLLIINSNKSNENHDALDELVAARPSYANLISKIRRTAMNIKAAFKYTIKPGDTVYVIRGGDTLESVARHYNVSVDQLRSANKMQDFKLFVGQQLIIPKTTLVSKLPIINRIKPKVQSSGLVYLVRKGDTIEKIARKFNANPAAIRLANLTDNSTLNAGDKLVIPGTTES